MSGNPFRRKAEQEQLPQLKSEEATKAFDDALQSLPRPDPPRRPSAVKKQVRIKTPPPLSPDSPVDTLIRRVSNEGHTGSPPPQSPIEGSTAPDDPFSRQFADEIIASQSTEAIENARRNSATTDANPPPAASMVLNPFQTTLASIEPGTAKDELQMKREAESGTSKSSGPGAAFDVDSFTKMLMTGAAPPVALNSGENAQPRQEHHSKTTSQRKEAKEYAGSTSSNPSASEPSSASYADLSSASSDDEDAGGIARQPVQTPQPKQPSSKPPPQLPRHKHGKSIQESGPQTVSFANFEAASANAQAPSPSQNASNESGDTSRQISGSSEAAISQSEMTAKTSEGSRRLRPPPPLPTTRRTSSKKAKGGREDAETSSVSSGQPRSPGLEAPSSALAKSNRAPPPPPSRRAGNRASLPPDQLSASEITSLNSDNTSLAGESMLSTDSSSLRQPATLGSRTSSGSVPTTTSSHMPPPPPPRRRRGSSKSSMEAPASGETGRASQDSHRNVSGLSQLSETGDDGQPPKDILADLSAFQAEVEALRAASLRRAS